jgi:hypothetical protein
MVETTERETAIKDDNFIAPRIQEDFRPERKNYFLPIRPQGALQTIRQTGERSCAVVVE